LNELFDPKKKQTKLRDIQSIMKDPALRAKLTNCVDEAVRCKLRIYTEQQAIKDLTEAAKNDVGIHPSLFKLYVNSAYNNDYTTRKASLEEMIELIDSVIGIAGPTDDSEE
jgi:hypothetical protein